MLILLHTGQSSTKGRPCPVSEPDSGKDFATPRGLRHWGRVHANNTHSPGLRQFPTPSGHRFPSPKATMSWAAASLMTSLQSLSRDVCTQVPICVLLVSLWLVAHCTCYCFPYLIIKLETSPQEEVSVFIFSHFMERFKIKQS